MGDLGLIVSFYHLSDFNKWAVSLLYYIRQYYAMAVGDLPISLSHDQGWKSNKVLGFDSNI